MVTSSGAFDSPARYYTAEEEARVNQAAIGNNVMPGYLNELAPTAGPGLAVSIDTGQCFVRGYWYQHDSVADGVRALATNTSGLPRIDLIVVKLDVPNGTITLPAAKTGVPAAAPVAPALTQNSTVWEYVLAQARVESGAATLTSDKLTDRRTFPLVTTDGGLWLGGGPLGEHARIHDFAFEPGYNWIQARKLDVGDTNNPTQINTKYWITSPVAQDKYYDTVADVNVSVATILMHMWFMGQMKTTTAGSPEQAQCARQLVVSDPFTAWDHSTGSSPASIGWQTAAPGGPGAGGPVNVGECAFLNCLQNFIIGMPIATSQYPWPGYRLLVSRMTPGHAVANMLALRHGQDAAAGVLGGGMNLDWLFRTFQGSGDQVDAVGARIVVEKTEDWYTGYPNSMSVQLLLQTMLDGTLDTRIFIRSDGIVLNGAGRTIGVHTFDAGMSVPASSWASANHAHDAAATGGTLAHGALTAIGTNSHSVLDTHLANTANVHGTGSSGHVLGATAAGLLVQRGQVTLGSETSAGTTPGAWYATAAASFSPAFSSAPRVYCTIHTNTTRPIWATAQTGSVDGSGFTVMGWTHCAGLVASMPVDWLAIGPS